MLSTDYVTQPFLKMIVSLRSRYAKMNKYRLYSFTTNSHQTTF